MTLENAADYLPHRPVREYSKREIIYDSLRPSRSLYVVLTGRVKVTNVSTEGTQSIIRIAGPDGMFGESSLIAAEDNRETAVALDRVAVMSWSAAEVDVLIDRHPALGLALSRYFVKQSIELQHRIVAMAAYGISKRVSTSLIQLAETMGTPTGDGAMRIASLTQYTIAEFVGTSREMLSLEMNRLRRLGMVRYSRKFIDVYAQALAQSLREEGHIVPAFGTELQRAAS
jgi:CRP-like cAMP-binding protein